jgi:hypothetical protein
VWQFTALEGIESISMAVGDAVFRFSTDNFPYYSLHNTVVFLIR